MSIITDLDESDSSRRIRLRGRIHHVKQLLRHNNSNSKGEYSPPWATFYLDLFEEDAVVDVGIIMRSKVYSQFREVVDRCPDSAVVVCRIDFTLRSGLVQLYAEEVYADD